MIGSCSNRSRLSPAYSREEENVIDIVYVAAAVAFFALMVAYVAACQRLGRGENAEERNP